MLATALVVLCAPAVPGGPADELFPGRWAPVQIGIVRQADQPEGEWARPRLEITLEWQPEDPGRLRWLSVEECRQAAERAARDFGPLMDTFILAGGRIYHPRAATTSFRYGGPAEVRMLFELPEGLPEMLDLFVRQSGIPPEPVWQPFSASAVLGAEAGDWRTGPVTWTLDRAEPGVRWPPPEDPGIGEFGGEYAVSTTSFPTLEPPAEATKITLVGTIDPGASLGHLDFESPALTALGQECRALRLTWARKQYAVAAGVDGRLTPQRVDDGAAKTYLMLWFPLPSLLDECELTLKGGVVPDPADAGLEHVFSNLPIPSLP